MGKQSASTPAAAIAALFERYAKGGENAKLKLFAGKTLPTIQDHQKMAEKLKP